MPQSIKPAPPVVAEVSPEVQERAADIFMVAVTALINESTRNHSAIKVARHLGDELAEARGEVACLYLDAIAKDVSEVLAKHCPGSYFPQVYAMLCDFEARRIGGGWVQ